MYGSKVNVDFWKTRWSEQRIGFHRADVNPRLLAHSPKWLDVPTWSSPKPLGQKRVLVPLCGKTLDLRWLAEQGANVVGVEFVEDAALSFFDEQHLPHVIEHGPHGKVVRSTDDAFRIELWVSDFFAITADDVGPLDAIYDRAALIAVQPSIRDAYGQQLANLAPPGARLLLVTFEHDGGGGPPFSVPPLETRRLLSETFALDLVHTEDLQLSETQLRERGYQVCREHVWLATRR